MLPRDLTFLCFLHFRTNVSTSTRNFMCTKRYFIQEFLYLKNLTHSVFFFDHNVSGLLPLTHKAKF
jgi:hypothetical protein